MASKIKVDQIEGAAGTTVSLPSGQTLDLSSGTVTLPNNAVDLSSAKVTNALPVAKGGTGLSSLGSAGQIIQVNSGASALEFAAASGGKIGAVAFDKVTSTAAVGNQTYSTFGLDATITPTATGSSILAIMSVSSGSQGGTSAGHHYALFRNVASGGDTKIDSLTGDAGGGQNRGVFSGSSEQGADWTQESSSCAMIDSSSTGLSYSSGQSIQYTVKSYSSGGVSIINRSWRDGNNDDDSRTISTLLLMELLA